MVGPLLMLMLVFIKALHQFRATEEECERLAVWVHALMGSFAKAAREGRVDADSTYLITAAETALQKLVTLVETRLDRAGGWFGKVKAFWTSAEFKEGMERAERGLHDALDALLMMVSVETRRDVAMVLDRAERLPFMDQKLDAVLETLQGVSDKVGGIDAKMDAAEARGKLMMQRLDEMQAGMKQRGGGSIFDTLTWAPFPRGEWLARGGDEEDEGEEDLSVLGTGASATTLRMEVMQSGGAAGLKPGMRVAVKRFTNKTLRAAGLTFSDIEKEVEILTMLRHPSIVRMYDIVSEKTTHYLVMQLADGGTLNDQIGRHPGAATILAWMSDVASAFEYIHGLRVYHRDVKLENLLLLNGRALVADFGLAAVISSAAASHRRTQAGTANYASPEKAKGRSGYNSKADMWAVGCGLVELASDKRLWRPVWDDASDAEAVRAELVGNAARASRVLGDVARGLLRLDPRERLSAFEMRVLLSRVARTYTATGGGEREGER
ncbi:kinase-like domain-containing protein [Baffinella frigidus]|nr:kinase-like domain-containing protein [Cryptophyta sp. CCMP2293]